MTRLLFVVLALFLWALSSERAPGADDPPQKPLPPQRPVERRLTFNESHDAATAGGKPLVTWVGTSRPDVVAALPDAVHCHCDSLHGDETPRVQVSAFAGGKLWAAGTLIGRPTAAAVRALTVSVSPASVSPVSQSATASPPAFAPAGMPAPAFQFGGDLGSGGCASCGSGGRGRGRRR